MAEVSLWTILIPPRFRPSPQQMERMETHMSRRFPDLQFKIVPGAWGGDDITPIPHMGSVGDGVWLDKPEIPKRDVYERIAQAAREFDPGATYALN